MTLTPQGKRRDRASALTRLDLIMRELDRALDRKDRRAFHLLAIKRRQLLRWLAK